MVINYNLLVAKFHMKNLADISIPLSAKIIKMKNDTMFLDYGIFEVKYKCNDEHINFLLQNIPSWSQTEKWTKDSVRNIFNIKNNGKKVEKHIQDLRILLLSKIVSDSSAKDNANILFKLIYTNKVVKHKQGLETNYL